MRVSAVWPLALFLVFSSLAFGCMEDWSIATCEVILFLGAAVVGWSSRDFWSVPRRLWLPALLLAVLFVIGLAQLVPLPASWWKAVGSDRYSRYTEGAEAENLLHTDAYRIDPFGPDADKPLPAESWTPVTPPVPRFIPATFTPAATGQALLALAAGLCLILLLERLAEEEPQRLRQLLWVCGGLGLFITAVALVQSTDLGRTHILWLRPSSRADIAFGPFVNENHGIAFVNLAMPALYYLLWRASGSTRHRLDRWGIRVVVLSVWGLQVVAVGLAHSLGGLLALGFYPAMAFFRWLPRRRAVLGAATAGAVLALVAIVWASAWWGLVPNHGRLRLLRDLPSAHWLAGSGMGSFGERYPAVATDLVMLDAVHYSHLENEYGQVCFEAGVVPALLGLIVCCAVLYLTARLTLESAAAFWLAPAMAGEALRCSGDFSMHCFPIVGAFLLLCIAGMVAIERGDHGGRERASEIAPTIVGGV